jgi:capsular polysaccharide biosynthesis protein
MRLEDGMVESRRCVALSPRFGFVRDSIRKPRRLMEKKGYVFHKTGELTVPERELVSVDFPAVHIALPFRHNYFHWMFEGLGRLLLVREFLPRDVRVAVTQGLASFESETLAAVGVAPDAVFELPPRRLVEFPELYVPPLTVTRDFALLPLAVDALRRLAKPCTVRQKRLYVTRQGSLRRRIVNHDEVIDLLTRHDFSEVAPERLSVREQIALFGQAEAVIGAHGAGLANAVFSAPGTLLIELQSPELREAQALFWNLAALCELRFVQIVCRPIAPRIEPDIEVDCSHLDLLLQRRLPRR